jgi:hypothetical protein
MGRVARVERSYVLTFKRPDAAVVAIGVDLARTAG